MIKMTSKEELENLQAQIANLKEAEDKIRTVKQDLESDARKLYHKLNP
jgi:prefoldin subunit 5